MNPTIEGNKIQGKFIAKLYEDYIRVTLEDFYSRLESAKPGYPSRKPAIVSFANKEDPSSVKYTKLKQSKAESLGIQFNIIYITPKTPFQEAKDKVIKFNEASWVDGIMAQLPITQSLQNFKDNLIELIVPEKDVDGLTPAGRKIYIPATVLAVLQILEARGSIIEDKIVAVVGSEGEIGAPLCDELEKLHPKSLIKIDKKNPGTNVTTDLNSADFVFSATGVRHLIKGDYLKPGVVAYDIGLGDLDPSVYQIASEYTPEFGGVGPNTVVALMRNVLQAYMSKMAKLYNLPLT